MDKVLRFFIWNTPQLLPSAEVPPCLDLIRNHFINKETMEPLFTEGRKFVNDVGHKRDPLPHDALLRGSYFMLQSLPFHDMVRSVKLCILLTLISYPFFSTNAF